METPATRYELARILGARALQIALGAPLMINSKTKDAMELAREELAKGKVPFIIVRTYPDGQIEKVEVAKWVK